MAPTWYGKRVNPIDRKRRANQPTIISSTIIIPQESNTSAVTWDMTKIVYDTNDDWIVNSAHKELASFINKTGATLTKGTIVYLKTSSSSANLPEVVKANASTEVTSSKTIWAIYEDVANDATGYIVTSGEVDNLNTSSYTVGTKLWLSTTDWLVTTTAPTAPSHAVFIGTVTRSQTTNGRVLYAIQNGYEYEELHNVSTTSYTAIQNTDTISIKESATSLWKPSTWLNIKSVLKTYFDTFFQLKSEKWQANGYVPLNSSIKIDTTYLPSSVLWSLNYQWSWNATTNSPTLSNATWSKWLYYVLTTWGTIDLWSWSITFDAWDWVVHNWSIWERLNDWDVSNIDWQTWNVTMWALINSLTSKPSISDADNIVLMDSNNTSSKRANFINIASYIQFKFASVFQPLSTILTNTTASFTTALKATYDWYATGKLNSTNTKAQYNTSVTDDDFVFQWDLQNPDFYKYRIVTSVSSWNLTVAIKNYLWNDPSATVPVKIQIGDTVRTITTWSNMSPSNFWWWYVASWSNWLNMWSTELATQEVDIFVYLVRDTTLARVWVLISRIPYATKYFDFHTTQTNEKWTITSPNVNPWWSDQVENIWRFNAILSATYQWSLPATSVIINRPIYETRHLTAVPTVAFVDWTAPATQQATRFRYKIVGDIMIISYAQEYLTAWTGNSTITVSLPFNENTIYSTSWLFWYLFVGWWAWYGASNGTSAQCRWKLVRIIWSSINSNGWIIWGQIQI